MLLVLLPILLLSALLIAATPNGDCSTNSYTSKAVIPTIQEYVNFSDSNPFILGDSSGQYEYYKEDAFGLINNSTFSSNSTLMLLSNDQWPVPGCGEISVNAELAFTNTPLNGTINSPLGMNSDPFYGAGWFGMTDEQYGWKLMFVLTNSTVFAWYQRFTTDATIQSRSQTFTYMVPIGTRQNQPDAPSYAYYSIVFNAAKLTISYRINGADKLLINAAGQPIDNRFLVGESGGLNAGSLPAYFQILFGVGIPQVSGVPFTTCQGSIFNQCRQSIRNAHYTYCQYYPKQDPTTFVNQLTLYMENFGLTQWQLQNDCPPDAVGFGCPDGPIPCCAKEPVQPKEPCLRVRTLQNRHKGK